MRDTEVEGSEHQGSAVTEIADATEIMSEPEGERRQLQATPPASTIK